MAVNQEDLEIKRLFSEDGKEPGDQLVKLAYLLPRSPEELRLKRLGFYGLAEGVSAFASGCADYAHSLLAGWYAHEEYVLAEDGQAGSDSVRAPEAAGLWRRVYEHNERLRSVITTSLYQASSLSGGLSIVQDGPHGDIRLNGHQTFGLDVLKADELLVIVHGDGTAALIPKETEGVKLVFAGHDASGGSSKSTAGSVLVVYENVIIPQERLLVTRAANRLQQLLGHPLIKSLAGYQWASRQLDAIELLTGTAFALAEQTGLHAELHIQGELGELIQGVETLKALLHAAEIGAERSPAGVLLPDLTPLLAARKAGIQYYGKAVHVLQRIGSAIFLTLPNVLASAREDEGQPSLLQLAWQLAGSSEAVMTKLHEQHAFGDPLAQSQELYRHYPVHLLRSRYREFWQAVKPLESDNESEVRR
ncbi:4-hydroxyphenylacetate 3-hydroxylase C-terminal domain-containing protein [Paenibacillus xylaniclasticus]|uniref:4-hydroxyphenylacetate 3-hydroxylase C-terminal domain-containing protein n=1 Tax=Paenibacillus xylaniclasticus TaxID=588083 RepID=UPI000FD6D14A|nr:MULTISPECIES: 4-hydroxyphenylacetate 3-hydroxylase C-terminal domain-containing protein [Paenibacillus]GFN30148.1 hypothetical protein PCURB6_04080 [Paenibacillus curdlanolyticus]